MASSSNGNSNDPSPAPTMRWTRSPTIHFSLHDGSAASYLRSTPYTVVPEMTQVISKKMNVVPDYRKGVGTKGGIIDKIIGGALGRGLLLSVMDSFIHLAGIFELGDIIMIFGFSRGSYAARILAALIAIIGIPKVRKLSGARQKELFQKIRAGLVTGSLWNSEKLLEIQDGFKFYGNVVIEALCVFDTVTAVGAPKGGLARHLSPFLKLFPEFRKDYAHLEDIVRVVPSAVRHFFQALPIHETRANYHEQVAQQAPGVSDQIFKQQWFFGNHGHVAQDNGRSCMVDAAFAWTIGMLHLYLPYLRLDETFLHRRFPNYPAELSLTTASDSAVDGSSFSETPISGNTTSTPRLPPWIYHSIPNAGRVSGLFHGHHCRTPGGYSPDAHETISPMVRHRGFGRTRDDDCMVPGYSPVQTAGGWEWKLDNSNNGKTRSMFWPAGEKKVAPLETIPEGGMTPLEKALLGMN